MWLVVAGRLASGKTTVARAVAPKIDAAVVTVSTVMKELSAALGVASPDRRELQDLGAALAEGGPHALGELLINAGGGRETVILDGLRAVDVASWLRQQLSPGGLRIVYLDANTDVRRARYEDRGDGAAFGRADDHAVERGAEELRAIADRIIDAERPLDAVQTDVIRSVWEWRHEDGTGGKLTD